MVDINEIWNYKCEGAIFSAFRIFSNDDINPILTPNDPHDE